MTADHEGESVGEYPGQPETCSFPPTGRPWPGHRDLCPIQWGEECDCLVPVGDSRHWSDGTPVDDAELEANSRDEQEEADPS